MQQCRSGKTKQQDDTIISKNIGDVARQVQVKSPTHYFGSFLIKFKKNIYYLLRDSTTFQGCLKIGRALPQLHKNYETFYRSNSRWPATSPSILKKAGLRYSATKTHLGQKGLYSRYFNAYMNQKTQKTTLPVRRKSVFHS